MKKLALLMGGLLFSGSLYALDTVSVEYGNGDSADMARIGAGWDWDKQWFADGDWLVVQDAEGNDAYTRNGNLRVNPNGILETSLGQPVRGNGGPISLPPYEKLFIGGDGQISIVPQGQTAETLVQVDRLRLVNPPATELVRSGDGLFNLRDGSTAAPDPSVRVASGQLESSNVNPAEALAEMIEMSRHYEMQVRAMNTADELDSASSRLIRMNG
jgi:flagellar basal-body rod protein FlgF